MEIIGGFQLYMSESLKRNLISLESITYLKYKHFNYFIK